MASIPINCSEYGLDTSLSFSQEPLKTSLVINTGGDTNAKSWLALKPYYTDQEPVTGPHFGNRARYELFGVSSDRRTAGSGRPSKVEMIHFQKEEEMVSFLADEAYSSAYADHQRTISNLEKDNSDGLHTKEHKIQTGKKIKTEQLKQKELKSVHTLPKFNAYQLENGCDNYLVSPQVRFNPWRDSPFEHIGPHPYPLPLCFRPPCTPSSWGGLVWCVSWESVCI